MNGNTFSCFSDNWILSLIGDWGTVVVWGADDETQYPYDEQKTTLAGKVTTYTVPMDEKVTITTNKGTAGNYFVNGEPVEMVGGTTNSVAIVMKVDKELDIGEFDAAKKVIAVHAGSGVTLTGVTNGTSDIESTKVTKDEDKNVWYVAANDMKVIKAKTTATTGAGALILTTNKNAVAATVQSLGTSADGATTVYKADTAGTEISLSLASGADTTQKAIDTDVYVYAASQVTSIANVTVKSGDTTIVTGTNSAYVKVGETLTTEVAAGDTFGVIATSATKTDKVKAVPDSSVLVENEAITLNKAWTVTLNGFESVATDTTETVKNGYYVVDGVKITKESIAAAGNVINTSVAGTITATALASAADVAVSAEVSLSKAIAIVKTANIDTISYKRGQTDNYETFGTAKNAETVYILPGQTLKIVGATTNSAGKTLKITVATGVTAPTPDYNEASTATAAFEAKLSDVTVDISIDEQG